MFNSAVAGVGREISVATYNCENVFVGAPQSGQGDQPIKSPASLAALSQVIGDTHADVIALQEVHDGCALDAMLAGLPPGTYPYRALVPGNDPRGINVAVLSRFPITNVVSHAGDRFPAGNRVESFARDFLEATIQIDGENEFVIGTTHLKSHAGGHVADARRLAEGRRIHDILADELTAVPGRRYIVCGDFNDTEDAPAVRAVMGNGGPAGLYDPLAGTGEQSHPATHRRIDFLLLNHEMRAAYVADSEHVFLDPAEPLASDHRPLVARFRM